MADTIGNKLSLPALDPEMVEGRVGFIYPDPFKRTGEGRHKHALGNALGLQNIGVNLTRLEPCAWSALRHWHIAQDEFIYVLEGEVTLITDEGEQVLEPGMAAAFPANVANGHHLVNRSAAPARILEVGDRLPGDSALYPDDDIAARSGLKGWVFDHRDGTPY